MYSDTEKHSAGIEEVWSSSTSSLKGNNIAGKEIYMYRESMNTHTGNYRNSYNARVHLGLINVFK